MSGTRHELGVVALAALPVLVAIVWATLVQSARRFLHARPELVTFYRLLVVLGTAMVVSNLLGAVFSILPREVHDAAPHWLVRLYITSDFGTIVAVTAFRHMARSLPTMEEPPSRRWLAVNYGSAVVMGAIELLFGRLVPAPTAQQLAAFRLTYFLYLIVMFGLGIRHIARIARSERWSPAAVVGGLARPDVLTMLGALGAVVVVLAFHLAGGWQDHFWTLSLLSVALGLLCALPLALRVLGDVVRNVLLVGILVAVAAAIYAAVHVRLLPGADPALRLPLHLLAVVGTVLVLVPLQAWLRTAIERVVFRRGRHRRAELQAFLHTLSPDRGGPACCRAALTELVRRLHLRGAAIVLRDGQGVVEGTLPLDALHAAWPRGLAADALPPHAVSPGMLRDQALRQALIGAGVTAIVPLASPRARWGHLFVSTGFLGTTSTEDDTQTLVAFADQLALLLAAAELLGRALAVERSLAHAEKLAAIGELAARVAHEIRNPVTAARSLAQQLVREPDAAFSVELGLILAELERVERQVAALLRFARRDDFRFEPVALAPLVREALDAFRPRLEGAGVALTLEAPDGIVARADREKLRQVLVNLVENALDALGDGTPAKRLAVRVASTNGSATIEVADSGPGVPPDALAHLFEPFFSLKEHGTGLGLAIAKRTIDAHGGRISAAAGPTQGMTFAVELPLSRMR